MNNATLKAKPMIPAYKMFLMARDKTDPVVDGQRIKKLRSQLGMTQSELAKAVRVSQPVISDWQSGNHSIKAENLMRLVKTLKTNEAYLMSMSDNPDPAPTQLNSVMGSWDSQTPLGDDEIAVPYMEEVRAAAGSGSAEILEYTGPVLRFAKSTIKKLGVTDPENARCAVVNGRSMSEKIADGAAIGVDIGFTEIIDGKIYVFDDEGELRLKYLYKTRKGGLSIRSHNRDEYPNEDRPAGWENEIRIIGRVFWWSSVDPI